MPAIPSNSLPTERDFDPWNGDQDAQNAWRNFGGLTIDEAQSRFRENPLYYQEDFMFMGGKAFAFYFPVLEHHLETALRPCSDDDYDHESWILAHCIAAQFDGDNLPYVRHLASRVIELAEFVRDNIHFAVADHGERQRVADAWRELVVLVEASVHS
jgi:hypothetical protein